MTMYPAPAQLDKYFPYYLSAERKRGLVQALKDVPTRNYYATLTDPEPLQGDGWRKLQLFQFETGARDKVSGLLLTNSCDLAKDNSRLTFPNINFVPLVNFSGYLQLLLKCGKTEERVNQHAKDIREQKVSDLFYLPALAIDAPEFIAPLNNIHTMPITAFNESEDKARLFSLSDVGFYFFVFKLSVHFCRLHENIDRSTV